MKCTNLYSLWQLYVRIITIGYAFFVVLLDFCYSHVFYSIVFEQINDDDELHEEHKFIFFAVGPANCVMARLKLIYRATFYSIRSSLAL